MLFPKILIGEREGRKAKKIPDQEGESSHITGSTL